MHAPRRCPRILRKFIGIRKSVKMPSTSSPLSDSSRARRVWGTTTYGPVTEEEMESAYVYKMDKPRLTQEEVAVEIQWGRVLWVVSQGDEKVKVKLPRSNRVKVSAATASMRDDGVLTVLVPKRDQPRKWYKYEDLGLIGFKMVHVLISG